ncbi:hypothetical protein SAMN02745221_01556 [Thermosyntropha lipolytica DSM 11003]|uniref:Uncharacterized protein n=1 Tax=Thermosyntropha lipolytica DSM 11003 TaxID=1123382 RepID=A0A1M5PUE9_9FIRM|nr:hypothetical protein SAMN02745221_01556 [Thermosyntropha lipolytica DSM 11003]
MNVDIVFYDVTAFHFENINKDDLRDFGFSKANKVNEVQVVMGLLIDSKGKIMVADNEKRIRSKTDISLDQEKDKRTFCNMFSGLFTGKDIGVQVKKKRNKC